MANSSLAHATTSHHGEFNPKSVFLMPPKDRIAYAQELIGELFGPSYTKVKVHFSDQKSTRSKIHVHVVVAKGGATDEVNARICSDLILRNALNCRDVKIQRSSSNSSGKSNVTSPVLSLTASTSIERIGAAERFFRLRDSLRFWLDATVAATLFWLAWEAIMVAWDVAMTP